MQIVFHSVIETENGNFNFDDVCNDICQKLVYRHPHVFGKVKAETEDEVLKNWDALKKQGKKQETFTETLESVPKTFPALLRAEKVCRRAERAGLPIDDAQDFIKKIRDGLDALEDRGLKKEDTHNQQILGDILLSFSNLDRILKTDGEKALTYSTNRFIIDFGELEKAAVDKGSSFEELPEEELRRMAEKLFCGL